MIHQKKKPEATAKKKKKKREKKRGKKREKKMEKKKEKKEEKSVNSPLPRATSPHSNLFGGLNRAVKTYIFSIIASSWKEPSRT